MSSVPAVRMKSPLKRMLLVVELEPKVRVPELLLTVMFGAEVLVSFSPMIAWAPVPSILIRKVGAPPSVPPPVPTKIRLFFKLATPVPLKLTSAPFEFMVRSLFTVSVEFTVTSVPAQVSKKLRL